MKLSSNEFTKLTLYRIETQYAAQIGGIGALRGSRSQTRLPTVTREMPLVCEMPIERPFGSCSVFEPKVESRKSFLNNPDNRTRPVERR